MAKLGTTTSIMAVSETATSETRSAATIIAQLSASPGTMIMAARRRHGLSQRALAGRLCAATGIATVSRHEVSRWERGTRLPSAYWLGPLAALLGIDRADFDRAIVRARRDRRRSRADVGDALSRWRVTRVGVLTRLARADGCADPRTVSGRDRADRARPRPRASPAPAKIQIQDLQPARTRRASR